LVVPRDFVKLHANSVHTYVVTQDRLQPQRDFPAEIAAEELPPDVLDLQHARGLRGIDQQVSVDILHRLIVKYVLSDAYIAFDGAEVPVAVVASGRDDREDIFARQTELEGCTAHADVGGAPVHPGHRRLVAERGRREPGAARGGGSRDRGTARWRVGGRVD